jgi:hypothetical protein
MNPTDHLIGRQEDLDFLVKMTESLYKMLEERHHDLMVFFGDICCDPQRWPIHLKPIWYGYLMELGCKKGLQSGDFFNIPSPSNEWKDTVAFPKDVALKALALDALPEMDLK